MAKKEQGEPRAVRTMRIGAPRIERRGGRARLTAEIRIGEDDVRPLWFEVEEKYGQYLCAERADAFLIGLLNFAQRERLDIVCEAPVTARLLYQIRTYLIPSLARNSKVLHETRIEAPMDDTPMANAGGVGTGISCGVDSLHVVKNYARSPYPGLSLTHLCLNNVGAFWSENGGRQYAWQAEHARQFAREYGFELIVSDSNLARPSSKTICSRTPIPAASPSTRCKNSGGSISTPPPAMTCNPAFRSKTMNKTPQAITSSYPWTASPRRPCKSTLRAVPSRASRRNRNWPIGNPRRNTCTSARTNRGPTAGSAGSACAR